MGFSCGLVGLPNVGKSTIFNAITNLRVDASSYPFCTIEPHHGIVPLEDDRLDAVYRLIDSAKKTPTILEFVDIAGLVQGASHGEGLGNQFLSHISSVDAIAYVIRCFEDANVDHTYDDLDPVRDARVVISELILKDTEIVQRRLEKTRTAAKSGAANLKRQIVILESLLEHLSKNKEIRFLQSDSPTQSLLHEMNLLTAKPVLLVANVDENHLHGGSYLEAIQAFANSMSAPCIPFCGKVQEEISQLDQEDQLEFLKAMGLDATGLQKLVSAGYDALNLVTFFTANENESHAWTITRGTSVVKAAARIHTDFEERFIKAEVVSVKDLILAGSMKALHDQGKIAIHGKDYIVQDGDLILFKV